LLDGNADSVRRAELRSVVMESGSACRTHVNYDEWITNRTFGRVRMFRLASVTGATFRLKDLAVRSPEQVTADWATSLVAPHSHARYVTFVCSVSRCSTRRRQRRSCDNADGGRRS